VRREQGGGGLRVEGGGGGSRGGRVEGGALLAVPHVRCARTRCQVCDVLGCHTCDGQ
jgi:hypothetical protein